MSDVVPESQSPSQRLAEVLRLPFTARSGEQDYPAVRAVQSHWNELRGDRICPARAELDPKPLAHCLDVMFVAELVAPSVARLRLCGQQLGELLGMEPRGMPLSVFFNGDARTELAQALAQVAQGARAVMPLRSDAGLGQAAIDGMLALMPLSDPDGRITRVLGVLETRGPAGRAPRRFRLSAPLRMESDPHPHPFAKPAPAARAATGNAERRVEAPAGHLLPAALPQRGQKPMLRVIKGGLA
ncbi:PAS domain-containing protein [Pararhodobacter sp.]|uniref:PAS domain-containing protein n=1 Tax=Pararhodobacter sp. TaxID=2127056 RepID=UPI002FDF0D58